MKLSSYYGGYRTRKFGQIFSDPNDEEQIYDPDLFVDEFKQSPFYKPAGRDSEGKMRKPTLDDSHLELLSYMLYARFGNSHIKSYDEQQFKYKMFTLIRQYGPTWEERMEIQEKLRILTPDELREGAKTIHNHAFADADEEIKTSSLLETPYINDQNTSNYKKSKIDGYLALWDALTVDVTEQFLDKFNKLFIKYTSPDFKLFYDTDITEDITYE